MFNCHFAILTTAISMAVAYIRMHIYLWFVHDVLLSRAYHAKHASERESVGLAKSALTCLQVHFLVLAYGKTPSLSFRLDSVVWLSPRSLYSAVWKGCASEHFP